MEQEYSEDYSIITLDEINTMTSIESTNTNTATTKTISSSLTFDLNILVDLLSNDQPILEEIQNKELILFLGTTNAGKTTTICFLGEKQLQVKQDTIIDPDGDVMLGDDVIDTVDDVTDFRIGHTCDSTTTSIHVCPLPGSEIMLADSCGFQDTQGITTDIANAVSLRNAMGTSSSLHPVIIMDVNVLGVDKGVPFAKLLGLILRFFNPIQKYLPSMSIFFTHGRPDHTEEESQSSRKSQSHRL